jgi:hypothetical protein
MLCLIERLGVVRAATDVFASFDIREHGANQVVANSVRASLSDKACVGALGGVFGLRHCMKA